MKKKKKLKLGKVVKNILLVLVVLLMLLPLIWTVFISLKSGYEIAMDPIALPSSPKWENYIEVFTKVPWGYMIKNTAMILIVVLPVGMALQFCNSFAISRIHFGNDKWNNRLLLYYLFSMMVPSFVTIFPVYMIINKLGLFDSVGGLILVHLGTAGNVLLLVGSFNGIPSELEEAAAIDGCSFWGILTKIYVPLMRSTITTLLILSFIGIWNNYALARTMIITPENRPISMATTIFKGLYDTDYGLMGAAIVTLTVPQLAVFAAFQKHIIGGITAGAVKG